jgi:hypothetical protein
VSSWFFAFSACFFGFFDVVAQGMCDVVWICVVLLICGGWLCKLVEVWQGFVLKRVDK